jgi:hypothetical protein
VPAAIITYFLVEQQSAIRDHERRITRLETKFEDCVDCSRQVREKERGGFTWKTYESSETNESGAVVFAVEIDVLSEQFRWDCGSPTTIVRENETPKRTYDLGEVIRQYSPERELKDAKTIVVVGTASSEGDIAAQERLAGNRIETLVPAVQHNLQKTIPVYGMNFGQYTEGDSSKPCSPDTAAQRRVLIVKVTKPDEPLPQKELGESLKRRFVALAEDKSLKFPIDIRKYSMFQKGAEMLVYGRKNAP